MKHFQNRHFSGKPMLMALTLATILGITPKETEAQEIKNIVLVHGAYADGSGWEGVYKILTAKGYKVSVVANPNTGLDDDAAATKRVLDRQDGPAILVGHSYGGCIISKAGNHPKVAGLVFVAAFVPESNEVLIDLIKKLPPTPKSGILPPDENGYSWYDLSKFHSGFCADVPKEKAAFMGASQAPIAGAAFASSVENPAWKSHPNWYVLATEDESINPEGQRIMAKRGNMKVTEVKGSHVVFISQPKAVAAVIEEAAKGSK